MHHRRINLDRVSPPFLQRFLASSVLAKMTTPGGFPVQTVHDEDPVPGLGIALAHVVRQRMIGGAYLLGLRGHGQHPGGLVHDDDVAVFMENDEAGRQMS
jgi:hypothetical protein